MVCPAGERWVRAWRSTICPSSLRRSRLDAERGEGWWWSGEKGERVTLKQDPTSCALAAAAADASFPARNVAEFVTRWLSILRPQRLGQCGLRQAIPTGGTWANALEPIAGSPRPDLEATRSLPLSRTP